MLLSCIWFTMMSAESSLQQYNEHCQQYKVTILTYFPIDEQPYRWLPKYKAALHFVSKNRATCTLFLLFYGWNWHFQRTTLELCLQRNGYQTWSNFILGLHENYICLIYMANTLGNVANVFRKLQVWCSRQLGNQMQQEHSESLRCRKAFPLKWMYNCVHVWTTENSTQ